MTNIKLLLFVLLKILNSDDFREIRFEIVGAEKFSLLLFYILWLI